MSCDVSVIADVEALVREAADETGRIDVLVNTAGLWVEGPSETMTEADWDRVVDVNLKGTFFCCSRAIPELRKTQGCIVNLSSDCGLVGTPETAIYTASKGGVSLFTKALALELASDLVRVNAVCPADIMTPMLQYQADTYGGGDPEGYFKRLLASYPQGDRRRASSPPRRSPSSSSTSPPRRRRRSRAPTSPSTSAPRRGTGMADRRTGALARAPWRRVVGSTLPILAALVLLAATAGCSAKDAVTATPEAVAATAFSETAPVRSGLMSPLEDWHHLRQVMGYLKVNRPKKPTVYLLGGSSTRECTVNDLNWRRQIVEFGGPSVWAFNLGSSNQSFDHEIEMVRLLPDVPTIVLIGINVGRYCWKPPTQAAIDKMVLKDEGSVIKPYAQHRFVYNHIAADYRKREMVDKWLDERAPEFNANFRTTPDVSRRSSRSASSAGSIRSSSTCPGTRPSSGICRTRTGSA